MFSKEFVQPAMSRSENVWSMYPWCCLSERLSYRSRRCVCGYNTKQHPFIFQKLHFLALCVLRCVSRLYVRYVVFSLSQSLTHRALVYVTLSIECHKFINHRMSQWLGRVIRIPKRHFSSALSNTDEIESKNSCAEWIFYPIAEVTHIGSLKASFWLRSQDADLIMYSP